MLDIGGKNSTHILTLFYFPPFQMHSCGVILFLPEKVKKRHSPGEETTVKIYPLHTCISFQPAAISTTDRSLPASGQFCRNKIHSIKGKQFQGEEANISRKALNERKITGILSQNNEEHNSETLEKIKDFLPASL